MATQIACTDAFALRSGEIIRLYEERPDGDFICIQARSCEMPPGDRQPVRQLDGAPVEQAAILACHLVEDKWQWLQLGPTTKEIIGDLLFNNSAEFDRWYYIEIEAQR